MEKKGGMKVKASNQSREMNDAMKSFSVTSLSALFLYSKKMRMTRFFC